MLQGKVHSTKRLLLAGLFKDLNSWDQGKVWLTIGLKSTFFTNNSVEKNNDLKRVINGQPLYSLRNNIPENTGRQ